MKSVPPPDDDFDKKLTDSLRKKRANKSREELGDNNKNNELARIRENLATPEVPAKISSNLASALMESASKASSLEELPPKVPPKMTQSLAQNVAQSGKSSDPSKMAESSNEKAEIVYANPRNEKAPKRRTSRGKMIGKFV